MRVTERIIAAHKKSLAQRAPDRRPLLIASWEQCRTNGVSNHAAEKALELADGGNANEVELAFNVLIDLAISHPSLQCHLSQLAKHRSATVRRSLAFYLSSELPPPFIKSVFAVLLRDKAASVRLKAIEQIGMGNWKMMLPELKQMLSSEQSDKVIESLEYWVPLLEHGYRVVPSLETGRFEVTALNGCGISSKSVTAVGPNDPAIHAAVKELRKLPWDR